MTDNLTLHEQDHARATPHKIHRSPLSQLPAVPVRVVLLISIPISLLVTIPVIIAWIKELIR